MENWDLWGSRDEHECLEIIDKASAERKLYRWLTLKEIEQGMSSRRIYRTRGYWTKITDRLALAGFIAKKSWGREEKHEITARGHEAAKLWKLIKIRMEQIK